MNTHRTGQAGERCESREAAPAWVSALIFQSDSSSVGYGGLDIHDMSEVLIEDGQAETAFSKCPKPC